MVPPVGPPPSGVFLAPVAALRVDPQRQPANQEDLRGQQTARSMPDLQAMIRLWRRASDRDLPAAPRRFDAPEIDGDDLQHQSPIISQITPGKP